MKNQKWFMAATAMLLVVLGLLAACQTTVPVSYTEPARLDMSGINRIAIDSNNTQVTTSISEKLNATGKYTVAPETELAAWKQWNIDRKAQRINAADLAGAYTGNAVRADSSYLGKELNVSGVVKEIGQSARGTYFVRLAGAGNDSVDVFFVPSAISKVAAIEKGQTISVIGECKGFNAPDMEDTAEILRILGAGRAVNLADARFPVDGLDDYPFTLDAVVVLKTASSVQDDSHTEKRTAVDSTGKTIVGADGKAVQRDVRIYDRSVTVDIDYQVLRARDGSLIGEGKKSATSGKSSNEDPSKLPAAAELVARTIPGPANEFAAEIVPTERSISITLAKESDNKEAKKEMGAAEKLVKAKNYGEAADAYGKIYAKYKNFAAGYNQAVLTEVDAGTETALELMEALAGETGNPLAQTALEGMQSRNAANQKAAAQLAQ
jgi:hypothetical protein